MTVHFHVEGFLPIVEIVHCATKGRWLKAGAMAAPYVAAPLAGPLAPLVAMFAPFASAILGGTVENYELKAGCEPAAVALSEPASTPPPKVKWVNLNAGKPGTSAHWVGEQEVTR